MKKLLVAIAGTAIIASAAHARIGENLDTCAKRYGNPVKVKLDDKNTGVLVFDKNDLTIKIHFTKGQADLIHYSPGEIARIDLDTALQLIEINGRDKKWRLLTKIEEKTWSNDDLRRQRQRVKKIDPVLWESKDHVLEASFSIGQGSLEIKAVALQSRLYEGL